LVRRTRQQKRRRRRRRRRTKRRTKRRRRRVPVGLAGALLPTHPPNLSLAEHSWCKKGASREVRCGVVS